MSNLNQILSCLEALQPVVPTDQDFPFIVEQNNSFLHVCLEGKSSKTPVRESADSQDAFSKTDPKEIVPQAILKAFQFASQTDSVRSLTRDRQIEVYRKILTEYKEDSFTEEKAIIVRARYILAGTQVGLVLGVVLGGLGGVLLGVKVGGRSLDALPGGCLGIVFGGLVGMVGGGVLGGVRADHVIDNATKQREEELKSYLANM